VWLENVGGVPLDFVLWVITCGTAIANLFVVDVDRDNDLVSHTQLAWRQGEPAVAP
jgi:hypothetical protein